jgi:LysR family glycine cleavage system transcriptional activator
MPKSPPPLSALRTFEAAARLGSFARAAAELHVTPAAVSHQIRGLEQFLGVKLFRRVGTRMVLTDDAAAAATGLRDGFQQIADAVSHLRGKRGGGTLTINATPAFATRWLVPRLRRFKKAHPDIELRVVASPNAVDFDTEDVDVAIRLSRGGLEGVDSVELFPEYVAPLGSTGFLRQYRIRRPSDVLKVPLLHDHSMRRSGRAYGWTDWLRDANHAGRAKLPGTHYDDGHLALQAATGGSGLVLGRLVFAHEDLAARRLKIALEPIRKMDVRYFMLAPVARTALPSVVAFRDWLRLEAQAFRRQLEVWLERGAVAGPHRPIATDADTPAPTRAR